MDSRIIVVTSAKGNKQRRRPSIKMSGSWLNEIGFSYNSLMTVQCTSKNILLKLCNNGTLNHTDLSRRILKDDSKGILHVRQYWNKKKTSPTINCTGFWLEKFGFTIGSVLAVFYDHGIINIRIIDFEGLPDFQHQQGKEIT